MIRNALRRAITAACPLALAALAVAQVRWEHREYLPLVDGPCAYDSVRDRFVLLAPANGIGSGATWEWDRGLGWLPRRTTSAPTIGSGHTLAYDTVHGTTVLFRSSGSLAAPAETWLWDGATWANANPGQQPTPRNGQAMAFDAARNRVVLFGGAHAGNPGILLGDTWEWNGATWSLQAATGPPMRSRAGLVFDAARSELVLFGGVGAAGALGDTWVYSGGVWAPRPGGPAPRSESVLAFDVGRSRVVMFGGSPGFGSQFDDTWEWDGTSWSAIAATPRPSARYRGGMAGDPVGGGVLLAGGRDADAAKAELWRWDGANWRLLTDVPQPAARHSHAMAFDELHGELLVFGGVGDGAILGDLWRWDGVQWGRAPTPGPSPRDRAAMAYDVVRTEALLFGGELPGFTNETWVWNGGAWTQRFPALAPTPRMSHAMAYDRQRGRVVLFGGANSTFLGDTWEWDGAAWQVRAGPAPTPRHGHAMTYDDARGVTVLYGGTAAGGLFGTLLADTWEWDGSVWTQRLPPSNPGPRRECGMTFDRSRGRTVLFGDAFDPNVWEWDGSTWLVRTTSTGPPPRTRTTLAYDPWRERVWLFGGQSTGPNHLDLWDYAPLVPAAVLPYGTACSGSAGLPAIDAGARPWLGDIVPLVLTNGPAGAPALLWGGASNSAFGSYSLPLPLASIGLPGCTLLASLDVPVATIADPLGTASLPVAIPNLPTLLGLELFCQGAFLDPPANPLGLAVSAAVTLRVGGR